MSDSKNQNLSIAISTLLMAIVILVKFFIGNQVFTFIRALFQH